MSRSGHAGECCAGCEEDLENGEYSFKGFCCCKEYMAKVVSEW